MGMIAWSRRIMRHFVKKSDDIVEEQTEGDDDEKDGRGFVVTKNYK